MRTRGGTVAVNHALRDLRALFGASKSAEICRERAGTIKTAKLPRSLAELRALQKAIPALRPERQSDH